MPVIDRAMANAIRNRTPESFFVNAFDKEFRAQQENLERRRWGLHFATLDGVAARLNYWNVRKVRRAIRRLHQRGLLPFAVRS